MNHFRGILEFIEFRAYIKPVPSGDQVVEYLDDVKGQTALHKRKVQQTPGNKNTQKIMDMKQEVDRKEDRKGSSKKCTEETASYQSEEDRWK